MFKVSTWNFHVGIAEDGLLGPYFLPPCLTRALYYDFFMKLTSRAVARCDLQTQIHVWFMHGGGPPHFLLAFWAFLYMFSEQWLE
jgi:hypothetical protein